MSYLIDGNSFGDYDMTVLSSSGALDIPKRIGDTEYDWGDSNGVEAYTDADDLFWDGRDIMLSCYYSGSDFKADIETFEAAIKGTDITLTTPYGTHSVRLKKISEISHVVPNTEVLIEITFFQTTVTAGSAPSAIGGSGITIGGYDFGADFSIHVSRVSGYGTMPGYHERKLSYGSTPEQPGSYRSNREISLDLNGSFADIATLTSKIQALQAVLMSAGTKALIYRGTSKNVYFTRGMKVRVNVKLNMIQATLNLNVIE